MCFIQHGTLNMMTSPVFACYLTCLLLGRMAQTTEVKLSSSVRQESGLVSASVGQSLTLRCFYEHDDSTRIFWYKQSLGQQPRLISTLYVFNKNGTFHDEYKNNPRFTLDTDITGQNHLTITDLHPSDSATYYCAGRKLLTVEFAAGIFVSIKGSGLNIPASVHQSASESIQPGGSVTLNCTVHTGTCDGEHSVYWFKTSEESHPGLIYTHGGSNDQCERKPNNQTHTCVYNLPMQSLDLSHVGTYYCAVVSCGHILFGNGTKLDFEDEVNSPVLVYFLSGTSAFTTILTVFLAFSMCMMNNRNSCHCTESRGRFSAPFLTNVEGYQGADKEDKVNRRGGQRDDTWSECVYFTVK
ncbi:immunoglobulin kappa light chain-like isoform X4 [Dicentrarchus labrax]|uniref:immunoglobulin kappa light chain-like isoform X2 n=1 Tax=Dicentrarchus labrax TaxID=13489 RepID=UPI0021F54274|nr:immunoglobulin kappa light chain-like isoform X2 [Dicentrarchus labrax]XP_051231348.1 immunoglobulin kappa light chain-like isoform X4 [Dicentrarchus labrax]